MNLAFILLLAGGRAADTGACLQTARVGIAVWATMWLHGYTHDPGMVQPWDDHAYWAQWRQCSDVPDKLRLLPSFSSTPTVKYIVDIEPQYCFPF